MKKVWTLSLATIIFVSLSNVCWGAVHPTGSDFTPFASDGGYLYSAFGSETKEWFRVTEPRERIRGNVSIFNSRTLNQITAFDLNDVMNDQTFAGINILSGNLQESSITDVFGSYLFANGVFGGINYESDSGGLSSTNISAGYRYNLAEQGYATQGYVALSLDYQVQANDAAIRGYELDVRYSFDKTKVFGQIYKVNNDDGLYLMCGENFAITDQLTAGLKYEFYNVEGDGTNGYLAGLTWHRDQLTLNAKLGQDIMIEKTYYAINGTYDVTDHLSAGLSYGQYGELEPGYLLKLGYQTGMYHFIFVYNKDYYTRFIP